MTSKVCQWNQQIKTGIPGDELPRDLRATRHSPPFLFVKSSVLTCFTCDSTKNAKVQYFFWWHWFDTLTKVCVYCAGFPCQPYSLLSPTRRMMYDENSNQLVKVVKRLRKYRPKVTRCLCWVTSMGDMLFLVPFLRMTTKIVVLENVMGFYCLVDALIEVLHANCSGYLGWWC